MTAATTPEIPPTPHLIVPTDGLPLDDPARYAGQVEEDAYVAMSTWIKGILSLDQPDPELLLRPVMPAQPGLGRALAAHDVLLDLGRLACHDEQATQWGYLLTPNWLTLLIDMVGYDPERGGVIKGIKPALAMITNKRGAYELVRQHLIAIGTGKAMDELEAIAAGKMDGWPGTYGAAFGEIVETYRQKCQTLLQQQPQLRPTARLAELTGSDDAQVIIDRLFNATRDKAVEYLGRAVQGDEQMLGLKPQVLKFLAQGKVQVAPGSPEHVPEKQKENQNKEKCRPADTSAPAEHPQPSNEQIAYQSNRLLGSLADEAAKDCCPKNCAAEGLPNTSDNPIHFSTGQELLYQHDFGAPGLMPVSFTRCYRSTHRAYDQGLLGARWTTAYTTAFSDLPAGPGQEAALVYHDGSGRNVRLPALAVGETHDAVLESFQVRRDGPGELSILYPYGGQDLFQAETPGHYPLRRRESAAGPVLHLLPGDLARRHFQALPMAAFLNPEALLVITDGEALWLECLPADSSALLADSPAARQGIAALDAVHRADQQAGKAHIAQAGQGLAPGAWQAQLRRRIGRIEQLLPDGSRHLHVRYRYAPALDAQGGQPVLELVEQEDALGHRRHYAYTQLPPGPDHPGARHLLSRYTAYSLDGQGFGQNLEWRIDPAWAPRGRDAGHPLATRCIRTVADDGSEDTRFFYRPARWETEVHTPDGVRRVYQYDRYHLILSVLTLRDDDSHRLAQQLWDKRGNLTKRIDAEGRTTCFRYDAADNLLAVIDPSGATTRYRYDGEHNPVAITDPAGQVWQREYDGRHQLLAETDPAGRRSSWRYDARGQLVGSTDARGGSRTMAYNRSGQLLAYTDCSGHTTRYSYDRLGRPLGSTDPAGQTTHVVTDRLGRIISLQQPDGSRSTWQYDAQGRLAGFTDPLGRSARQTYNGQGLPQTLTDPLGQTLTFHYNSALQLVALENQNGERTTFRYDTEGRLREETAFDGQLTRHAYSDSGQLLESRQGKLHFLYRRDELGRLLRRTVQAEGEPGRLESIFRYDALGRLVAAANDQVRLTFAYDATGQLLEETQSLCLKSGGTRLERCFTLRHELNALGQRSATTLPHGRRLDLQRYGPGHWIGALWNGRPLVDVERDALHRELVRTWAWQPAPGADGTTPPRLERSWDSLSRPARWRLTGLQGETLSARSWRYDPAGQMLAFEDLRRGEFHYAYDAAGQLRQARQPGLEETFAFDPAGNLMFLPQEASRPALANTAGRDHAHWDQGLDFLEQPAPAVPGPLPPVRHNQLLRYAEGAYRYDARGNVINKLHQAQAGQAPQHLHLHYDLDNRLSRALRPQPGGTLEALYTYDPLGRRVAKQVRSLVPTASASHALQVEQEQLTCFVWDGDLLLQEIADDHTLTHLYEPESFVPYAQVLSPVPATLYDPATVRAEQDRLERQAAEQQTEAETLAWLALTQPAAHTQLQATLAERDAQRQAQARQQQDEQAAADQVCYLLTDPLGTPQEAYSPDGRCLWQARYKAWGRIFKLDHAAIHQPLRFQGQYHDEETGLHYNRHRYYDPDSGRYLTQDPIGLEGGVNVYNYPTNPVQRIDPLGLCPCGDPAEIAKKAASYEGSSDWAYGTAKGRFAKNTNKCNLFVEDILTEQGSNVPDMNGVFSYNGPTAGQWGDPNVKIPGYIVVETPQPGDIVAIPHRYSDATGHVGIVTAQGKTASQSAITDAVENNNWGFRPGQKAVFRRCTCPSK